MTWEHRARTNSGLGFSVAPEAKVEVVSRRSLELSRVCILQGEAGSWFCVQEVNAVIGRKVLGGVLDRVPHVSPLLTSALPP